MKKSLINEINDMKYLFGYKRGVVISEQDVAEPEVAPDTDIDVKPSRPTRPNPFNPDRAKEFNPFPDLEPQGKMDDEQNEPFVDDPEVDYDENRSLEDLVAKYLGNK